MNFKIVAFSMLFTLTSCVQAMESMEAVVSYVVAPAIGIAAAGVSNYMAYEDWKYAQGKKIPFGRDYSDIHGEYKGEAVVLVAAISTLGAVGAVISYSAPICQAIGVVISIGCAVEVGRLSLKNREFFERKKKTRLVGSVENV